MLKWEMVHRAPVTLSTHQGAATLDRSTNVAYFSRVNCVYAYHVKDDKWTQLPECPREQYGLAAIRCHLTAVGGVQSMSNQPLDTLVSLREGKWVELYPPMPSKRSNPAVVTTDDQKYVIVAGGRACSGENTTAVELLESSSLQWSKVCHLPTALHGITAAVGDGSILCFGEVGPRYMCRVDSLLSSSKRSMTDRDTPSHTNHNAPECSFQDIWKCLPSLTLGSSCPVVIRDQLLAAGGIDAVYDSTAYVPNYDPEKTVHQFNRVTNSWMVVATMLSAREGSLVLALPASGQLLVAGGRGDWRGAINETGSTVELGTVCGIVDI